MAEMQDDERRPDFPKREEEILAFWEKHNIFEKSLAKTQKGKPFTFYDGPPFATGLPHYGHILASTIKDVIPRYQTMHGRFVRRRWGWDCHGLPVEEIVERKLGISGKKRIEKIGIKKFNETCRDTVLTYVQEWGKMIRRIARWVDFENSYKTMDADYMESVWWAFKQIYKKGLVYEGRKVLLYCPRCETPVSNFEVAMDDSYETVTEEAVTVKFKVKGQENMYLLAWTTTPWTLPGNVALAVGENVEYVKLENKTGATSVAPGVYSVTPDVYLLAKDIAWKAIIGRTSFSDPIRVFLPLDYKDDLARFASNPEGFFDRHGIERVKGKDLAGLEYESIFDVPAVQSNRAFKVYAADFVTTDEGTGVVHTAVVYGQEDYELGLREGLPAVPLLDEKGIFNEKAPKFLQGAYFKDAERLIKDDLEKRKLLFSREKHTHSYPHCWRCGTVLFYSAIPAWFINIQKIKKKLLASNAKDVNWFPAHLKHGRYEKSVEQAPDWNISRNRYWGNPIPVWRCSKCNHQEVVGGLDELARRSPSSGNSYVALRHGQSETQLLGIADSSDRKFHLTPRGRRDVERAAQKLSREKFDLIVTSPILRTRETAGIVAGVLKVRNVVTDKRLGEIDVGVFDGKPVSAYHKYFTSRLEKFTKRPPKGESLNDLKKRLMTLMQDLERTYRGKRILLVSHEYPIWILWGAAQGLTSEAMVHAKEQRRSDFVTVASTVEIPFRPLPRNSDGDVDLHRPYVDDAVLVCPKCGGTARRVPEIFDSWTEAGSMPFAEYHYPFENEEVFRARFPAQFVAEYIAQTRAWFYTMHVIALALFGRAPFENVVTTGTILAADGAKMSKSKGNFPDPWDVIRKYGVDSLRFYLMNSAVMQADNLNFNVRDLENVHRRVTLILWNVYNYFATYAPAAGRLRRSPISPRTLLDQWIGGRTQELVSAVTKFLNAYDTVRATRAIAEYVDDLSRWYVRRSRGRDDTAFFATLSDCLLTTSKVIAPFMPYLAERLYQNLRIYSRTGVGSESVHLTDWPKASQRLDQKLTRAMAEVRRLASAALAERARAGIKVRQPLQGLKVKSQTSNVPELLGLLRDEVNVKEVVFDPTMEGDVWLDTAITPALREEGTVRELIRTIQELRRDAHMQPRRIIHLQVDAARGGAELLGRWQERIARDTNARITIGGKRNATVSRELDIEQVRFWIGVKKARAVRI